MEISTFKDCRIIFSSDAKLKNDLKIKAEELNVSQSELIRFILKKYLNETKEKEVFK